MGRNAQMRRFRRDMDHELNHKGPSGVPDPIGNRAYRRSGEGVAVMGMLLDKLRYMASELREEKAHE